MWSDLRHDDLVSVGVDDEIWVMRDHNYLTLLLCFKKEPYEFIEDGLWIEVFLRLVND